MQSEAAARNQKATNATAFVALLFAAASTSGTCRLVVSMDLPA